MHAALLVVALGSCLLLLDAAGPGAAQAHHAAPAPGCAVVVDTLLDGEDSAGCSLRDAIASANGDTAVGGCAAGCGADLVTFAVTGTIRLALALPAIAGDLTIDGGNTITLEGGNGLDDRNGVRVLHSAPGARLAVDGLAIANGYAEDGRGGCVLNEGDLALDDTTVRGCVVSENGTGSGIYNLGALTLRHSVVRENGIPWWINNAVGIANAPTGLLVLESTVVSGNTPLGQLRRHRQRGHRRDP